MPSQATLPSQNDVWGISPLRVESELTAQKRESWRRWGLSEQFGSVSDNSSGERTSVNSLMGSPSRRVDTVAKLTCFPEMDSTRAEIPRGFSSE